MIEISKRAIEIMIERNKSSKLEVNDVYKGHKTWHEYNLAESSNYPSTPHCSPSDILRALDEFQKEYYATVRIS